MAKISQYYGIAESLDNLRLIPSSLITEEIEGLYGQRILSEMNKIIRYYEIYEKGVEVRYSNVDGDSETPKLKLKFIRELINKEARFMMGKTPEFKVKNKELIKQENKVEVNDATVMQNVLDTILNDNKIGDQLLKAAKDCLIGKRVACVLNFNETNGVTISFVPSLEFVYEQEDTSGDLTKFICFYQLQDTDDKYNQRLYKKKYWLEDGSCFVSEEIYDGYGSVVETIISPQKLNIDFIPAQIVLNDGLLGDLDGESEVKILMEDEQYLTYLNAKDMKAVDKNMNPVRYAIDASPGSTKDLSIAPGAFWDLATSEDSDTKQANVGILESSMSYSDALNNTFKRIKSQMFGQVDVPVFYLETMLGSITSGKGMRAVYWGLITRTDEKMLSWKPFLSNIAKMVLKGIKAYPISLKKHGYEGITLPDSNFDVVVENLYPIPEDEESEKQVDIMEVNAQTMSKKAYMMKWRGLTEEEALKELQQIAIERELIEDSYSFDNTNNV